MSSGVSHWTFSINVIGWNLDYDTPGTTTMFKLRDA